MKQRPAGVVVSAIAIGFVSLGLLVGAAIFVVAALVQKSAPSAAVVVPGQVPPSAAAMMGAMFFMALVMLAFALWGGATAAGLLRMKPWSRISGMILGGGLAVVAAFGLIFVAMVPTILKTASMPPGTSAQQVHVVISAMAILLLLVGAVGAWWIVYYALGSTRKAFDLAATTDANGNPLPAPERGGRVAQTGPLTDFTFAQPLPPEELPQPAAEAHSAQETPEPPAT